MDIVLQYGHVQQRGIFY